MNEYTVTELEEARASLVSTLHKCEKIQQGGRLQSSQQTLNDRRVRALRIALALVDRELSGYIAQAEVEQERRDALDDLIVELEAKHGPVDPAEVEALRERFGG